MKNVIAVLGLVSVFVTSTFASASLSNPADVGLQAVKTFDGKAMTCQHLYDTGRMAYRVTAVSGVSRAGQLEVTVNFETLKCLDHEGVFRIEKAGLAGRLVNPFNGFTELQSLELVAHTPDFKFVQSQSVKLNADEHSVRFVAPIGAVKGLLPLRSAAVGSRKVVMAVFLRGLALFGDARTGVLFGRDTVAFGSYNLLLSESDGSLIFVR